MEKFGINFHSPNKRDKYGVVTINAPKYNAKRNRSYFNSTIALFTVKGKKLVPVNDEHGSFSDDELKFLYSSLYSKKPTANKIKIVDKVSSNIIKYE